MRGADFLRESSSGSVKSHFSSGLFEPTAEGFVVVGS